jgi:hypothetical protein
VTIYTTNDIYWKSSDGRRTIIADMDNTHLYNAIGKIVRSGGLYAQAVESVQARIKMMARLRNTSMEGAQYDLMTRQSHKEWLRSALTVMLYEVKRREDAGKFPTTESAALAGLVEGCPFEELRAALKAVREGKTLIEKEVEQAYA